MGSHHVLKLAALVLLVVFIAGVFVLRHDGRRNGEPRPAGGQDEVMLGVLGDSDSAAYQDRVAFPDPAQRPGGAFHAITLQWPEALVRLRQEQVDLGEWAVWGVPPWASVARVRDGLRLPWRGPRRETHQHNLAWASGCESLTEGPWRQAQRLVDVMDEQPGRWATGVVVIRSGVNSFGKEDDLAALAENPDDPGVVARMGACVAQYRSAVSLIHERHPSTKIVLVGIFNNANWAPYLSKWVSGREQINLDRGLDHFDHALRTMARSDPRLAFFDDRAWFAQHWGRRDPDTGQPAYRSVQIGEVLSVTNSVGDSPDNAVLANEHAGLVWNLLWSQQLVQLVRERFDMPIDAVTSDEVAQQVKAALDRLGQDNGARP